MSFHNYNKMNSQIPPSPEIIPIGENKMAVKTMQQYNIFGELC